jgi:chromosome segregation ATPase
MNSPEIDPRLIRRSLTDIDDAHDLLVKANGKLDLLCHHQHRHTISLVSIDGWLRQHAERLYSIDDKLAMHDVRFDRLEHRMDQVQSDVGTLKSDVATLKADVAELKVGFATMQATMESMQATIGSLVGVVRELVDSRGSTV